MLRCMKLGLFAVRCDDTRRGGSAGRKVKSRPLWTFFAGALIAGLLLEPATATAGPLMTTPGGLTVSDSGAAIYSVPIEAPPGTAGMVPSISLNYSSQAGDGVIGPGWYLGGLSSITRCARTVAQDSVHGGVNYDSNDRFCFDGQRLMLISGTYGADGSEYRTEIDSFARVIAHGSSGTGPSYFEVHTKSGLTVEFGNTTDSKILAVGTSTVRVWAVNKVTDTKTNYLTVSYTNDTTNGQYYPTEIDYTGNTTHGTSPYNSIRFVYGSRSDVVPRYHAGSLQQTTVQLTNIKTYQGASTVVRDYRIGYTAATFHSRVTTVRLCDGAGTCLPATTFTWQGGNGLPTMSTTPTTLATGSSFVPGDFNGDGLTDVLIASGSNCGIWQGSNSLTFSASGIVANYDAYTYSPPWTTHTGASPCFGTTYYVPINGVPSDLQGSGYSDLIMLTGYFDEALMNNKSGTLAGSSSTAVFANSTLPYAIADFNGDGRMDAIFTTYSPTFGEQVQYSNGDGTFAATGPSFGVSTSTFLTGDFDGDGCMDVLSKAGSWSLTYSCNPAVSTLSLSSLPAGQVSVGDFNGDGLTDILVTTSTTDTLYLSTGTGFAPGITLPTGWGNYNVVVGDWNGDGRDDIALIAPGGGTHHILLSTGTGFVDETTFSSFEGQAVVADWNNTGSSGLWMQGAYTDAAIYTFAFVPEVITSIDNGIGATTTIAYDRLNQNGSFYSKGTGAAYPIQDVDGPIYTVKQVNAANGIGGSYTTNYSYAGLKKDLSGRGFLGFTTMTVSDPQTNQVQTTTFSTTFPYIGMVTGQTTTDGAVTLRSVSNTLENVVLATGTYFVGVHSSSVSGHDLNGTALPSSTTTNTYDCDGSTTCYGNLTQSATSVSDGSSSTTTLTYKTPDTTHWLLNLVSSRSVNNIVGSSNRTQTSSFDYQTNTNFLSQTIVEPSDCEYKLETDYTLDDFGNRTQTQVSGAGCSSDGYATAIATRTTYATFDGVGEFMTSFTDAIGGTGHVEYFTNDPVYGGIASHTDKNSHVTSYAYDTFGRLTTITYPDTTKKVIYYFESTATCSSVWGWSTCPPTPAMQVGTYRTNIGGSISGVSAVALDSLGRAYGEVRPINTGNYSLTLRTFDAAGRVSAVYNPFQYPGGSTGYYHSYTYDDLGRVTRDQLPGGTHHVDYAYSGLTTTVTDSLGHSTVTTRNAQGLVASVQDALSHTSGYSYDAFGNLLTASDPSGNTITNAYDTHGYGRKTDSYDPDMGHWTYVTDVLGELKKQTDAKSQVTTLTYDALGRPTERAESGFVSNWIYDSATYGYGLPQKSCTSSSSDPTCSSTITSSTFTYDALSRPSTTTINVDSTNYTYTTTYNGTTGYVDTVTYPSGFVRRDVHDVNGNVCLIADAAGAPTCWSAGGSTVFWVAGAQDGWGHLASETTGNLVTTTRTYDAASGLLATVRSGPSNSVAQFDYTFDTEGNLTYRSDDLQGVFENYCYDALNRLTNSATGSSAPSSCSSGTINKTIGYDATGNITSKSDVGTYSYPSAGGGTGSRPHALSSISGTVNGVSNPSYSYDGNGNMTTGAGFTVSYTAFNMADTITQGSNTTAFIYDANHTRIKQCVGSSCGTSALYYLSDPASGSLSEKVVSGGTTTWHDYLTANGQVVAERFCTGSPPCTSGATWRYFVSDHLGSAAVLTDGSGSVTERLSYDAWGRRRNSNGTDASCGSIASATTVGFTGHEMLDGSLCEINANARVYDPTVGRFMSADSVISAPFYGQAFNRYSYVENGPLSAIDPSGHDCMSISSPGGGGGGDDCGPPLEGHHKSATLPSAALDFMEAIRAEGGWGGPYWDARFAAGIANSPLGAMGSNVFAGPSGLFPNLDTADISNNEGVALRRYVVPDIDNYNSVTGAGDTTDESSGTYFEASNPLGMYDTNGGCNEYCGGARLIPAASVGRYNINLLEHEFAGGHTIKMHVGKTIMFLLNRVAKDPDISTASSFYSLREATSLINLSLNQYSDKIQEMMAVKGDGWMTLDVTFDRRTGYSVTQGVRGTKDVFSVFILLRKPAPTPEGFVVWTAFPHG